MKNWHQYTKESCIIFKKIGLFFLVLVQTSLLFAQTEESMWLGEAELVMPSNLAAESRTIGMSMIRSWTTIPNSFIREVGGVSFVEVAKPAETFRVNTFSLECDYANNKTFAMINGVRYDIPLNTWMLQPIVNYANDTNNAAVTLFGGIRFHPAFLDRLIGLRLLQMDLLLAGSYIKTEDVCKLPSFKGNDIVLGPNEKYNKSVCRKSKNARNKIDSFRKTFRADGSYCSYIYTDLGENIAFEPQKGKIQISGNPYYRFNMIDSASTYRHLYDSMSNFWNTFTQYWDNSYGPIESYYPTITAILRIANYNITDKQKTEMVFALIDSSLISSIEYDILDYCLNESLYWDLELRDSILAYRDMQNELNEVWSFFTKEWNNRNGQVEKLLPTITKVLHLANYNISDEQKSELFFAIIDSIKFPAIEYPFLTAFMEEKKIIKFKETVGLTNYLKEHNSIVYDLNPTVVTAAQSTCQWTAFFRYAKEKNPENWNHFCEQVKLLTYDAPEVYTPVEIVYPNDEKNK